MARCASHQGLHAVCLSTSWTQCDSSCPTSSTVYVLCGPCALGCLVIMYVHRSVVHALRGRASLQVLALRLSWACGNAVRQHRLP